MLSLLLFSAVIHCLSLCDGYKILVVFPNPSRSHGNLGDAMVRLLLKAGHEITYITPFVTDNPHQNLTYIDVSGNSKAFAVNPFGIKQLINKEFELDQYGVFHLMRNLSMLTFDNKNVKNLLENSTKTFDVVVAEWMFNELYSGFAAVFKCPLVWMFPFEPNFVAFSLIDEPTNSAYATNFELNITPPFTFIERLRNLWFQITYRLQYYLFYDLLEKEIYNKVFAPILLKKHGSVVPYETLRYNASLMLSYSNNLLSQPLSIPQNLIPVGGYHVDEEPAQLPETLKKILDDAKEGVIYFSMGSNLKSKDFPKHILDGLIEVFQSIKYKVLWKFEESLTGYSDNVHILKWAPQQSILAHPNCRLFITHGGLLSTTEAIHFGVPIIGIPVFYDQFGNVDRAVERGFAKKVLLSNTFVDDLKAAIQNILTDTKYAAKAKELSLLHHDRPVSPGTSLVHWIQHVVATKGALHLRSPALSVPWYQKYYLDLGAVILLMVYAMFGLKMVLSKRREHQNDVQRKKTS